jgi:hypothetical protein
MPTHEFDTIIYHKDCPDGFTGAWTFWHTLGESALYIPSAYGDDPPDVKGCTVAIVDFSYPRKVLVEMSKKAKYLLVLDHHRSAEKELQGLDFGKYGDIIFDMKRCGAQIAWNYLHTTECPWFIDQVADRDLWTKTLPYTDEIAEALYFDGYFQHFCMLEGLYRAPNEAEEKGRLAQRGPVLLEYKNRQIASYAEEATPAIFTVENKKYNVYISNCPRIIRSEVGEKIYQRYKCQFVALYWHDYKSNKYIVSLRSEKSSPLDLSEIAHLFPVGGGHPTAASFTIDGNSGENIYTYFTPLTTD